MEVIGGMVGMGFVGWWLDSKLDTSPWCILSGFGLALAHTVWAALKFMNPGKNPLEELFPSLFKKPPTKPPSSSP